MNYNDLDLREKDLPQKWLYMPDLRKNLNDIDAHKQRAQSAWIELQQVEDLPAISTPQEATLEWLEGIVEKRLQALNDAEYLTTQQKQAHKVEWAKWKANVAEKIEAIQSFFKAFPTADFDEEAGEIRLDGVTQIARERATKDVPDAAYEHWQLLKNVLKSIDSLREWEQSHNVVKIEITRLLAMSADYFCQIWCVGNPYINPQLDKYLAIPREMNDARFF